MDRILWRRGRAAGVAVVLWVGCGPAISVETDGTAGVEDSGDTQATSLSPSPTTGAPTGPTTNASLDTGGLDTSEVDTSGGMWLDLPEHCSTFAQDCPPGYKCMPYANDGGPAWNDTKCVPLADETGGPGDPCTVAGTGVSGIDDCDGTSMCFDVDHDTGIGVCFSFCMGSEMDPVCPDRCDRCSISGDGVVNICLLGCDPLAQDCADGDACYPINDAFACATDASVEGAGIGSSCEFINACPPGLACMNADAVPDCMGAAGCCVPYCPADGADPCPGLLPGTSCVSLGSEGAGPPEQCVAAEPGVCLLP